MNLIADSLFLPAAILAVLAWYVPKAIARLLPEGVFWLIANALLSTVILFVISAGFFALLYIWQGIDMTQLSGFGWAANVAFFGRLGLIAGLIWAPFVVLSVANLPRKWTRAVW